MKFDEGTKKGALFALGTLLSAISVFYFAQQQVLAFVGILTGIFFIVRALS